MKFAMISELLVQINASPDRLCDSFKILLKRVDLIGRKPSTRDIYPALNS